jgi:hypothetical protein
MRAALVITSISRCTTAQETLRVQDTVAALRRIGWAVDVLTPCSNPILSATLDPAVRVFKVPRIPLFRRTMMFLRGVALAARRDYMVLHGFDEGVGIARAIDRFSFKRSAYVAEVHHPETVGITTVARAAAVVVPDEATIAEFREPPPMARVSVLPDPHAELADNAFTAAEFASALDGIYTYVLRTHPEMLK